MLSDTSLICQLGWPPLAKVWPPNNWVKLDVNSRMLILKNNGDINPSEDLSRGFIRYWLFSQSDYGSPSEIRKPAKVFYQAMVSKQEKQFNKFLKDVLKLMWTYRYKKLFRYLSVIICESGYFTQLWLLVSDLFAVLPILYCWAKYIFSNGLK